LHAVGVALGKTADFKRQGDSPSEWFAGVRGYGKITDTSNVTLNGRGKFRDVRDFFADTALKKLTFQLSRLKKSHTPPG
jgi:hypothetical protein